MRVPFVVYADFEAFTQKLDDDKPRDNNSSYTSQYEKHLLPAFVIISNAHSTNHTIRR